MRGGISDEVIRAYEEQIEAIEAMGGRLVLMASRALARAAKSPADYAKVYGRILARYASRSLSIGWAKCPIRRSPVTGAASITAPAWRPPRHHAARTPSKWTA